MRESALWGGNASCAASMPEQATFVSLSLSAHADMIHEQRQGVALLRRRSCSLKSGVLWLEMHLSSQISTWTAWASRAPRRPAGIRSQHEGHYFKGVRACCAARCCWIAACELNSVRESALWGGKASCAASMPEQATFVSLSLSAYADMIHEQRQGVALLRRRSCSLKSGVLWLEVHMSSQVFTWTAWARRAPRRPAGI